MPARSAPVEAITRPAPNRAAPKSRDTGRLRRSDQIWGYLLIAPTVLGLGVFYLWPTVQTFYFSFTDWGIFGGQTWTGLENYRELIDPAFGRSMLNTLLYTAIVVGLGIPLATVVAALLNVEGLAFRSWYRAAYFIPVVTLPAAVGVMWRWLYNGDFGILNHLLSLVGISGPAWISNPSIALPAIAVVGIWMTLGYNVVIILAGMQEVPRHLYEAAMIDGAGPVRRFLSITVPMISPTLFFVTVLGVIRGLQVFDIVFLMVGQTSPAFENVRPIVYFFYQSGFVENDKGYAAAVAFVLFVVIAAMTALQFAVQRRWVQQ